SVAAETRWAIRGSVYQPSTLSHLTLVNVRLGELESVLDQFDAWLGSTFDDNFHGIETKRNLRIIQHAQPGESAARDASPLIVPDCFEGPAKILAATSFHFHEDERVVVATA